MKKIFLFAAIVAGIASLASCTKEQNQSEGEKVTITVSFPEVVDSKVAMEEGQQALDLKWTSEDKIFVIGQTTEEFTIGDISTDGKTATFTGNVVVGDKFDVVLSDKPNYSGRDVIYDYKQKSNGSTEHVIYEAVLEGVDTYENVSFTEEWAEEHGGTFKQSGCVQFNIQIPVGCTQVNSVKILASDRLFNSTHAGDKEKAFMRTANVGFSLPAEGQVLTLYWMTSMIADVFGASSQISVLLEGNTYTFIKDLTFTKETRILPGKRNVITLNGSGWMKTQIKYSSDAGLRQTWTAPYANTCNTIYGPGFILDGTASQWHLSNGDQGYIEDSSYTEWYTNQSDNPRFKAPMVGIVNLGKAEYIAHMYIQVAQSGNKYSTARVEVYLSNDESNDAELGEHLNQNLLYGLTNDMVDGDWAKWSAKRWVKYVEIPVTAKYIDIYPGHYKAKYIMLVLHSNEAWPYLNLQAINPKVYAKVD